MIAIIDYGLGNLGSVKNALDTLGVISMISKSAEDIKKSDSLILPGVGAAGEGMKNVRERKLEESISEAVKMGKPILGLCLGMQLLMSSSEEGNVNCLNIIEGKVKRLDTKLKVPQIGWNNVVSNDNCQLFKDIPMNSYFYFVHSYYCAPLDKTGEVGVTKYGNNFCSVVQKNNIYGVQFHPEKSGENGLKLLQNFSKLIWK
jgi:glutamine amidotransferase